MKTFEILPLLEQLVRFKTTNDNALEITRCYDFIDNALDFYPFHKQKIVHNGVESRIWSTTKEKHTKYILNAHVDVVPASDKLFTMEETNGRIVGRGVSDMKYSIPIYIEVLRSIFEKTNNLPSLAIVLTSDEERGGVNGVGHIINSLNYSADLVFVPDGGEGNHIVESAKGVLQLEIKVSGSGAHAARLWEGDSAIDALVTGITRLRKQYPFPNAELWGTTVNIGQIQGGKQTNQVADEARALFDIRYTPDQTVDGLLAQMREFFPNASINIIIHADAFTVDRKNAYVKRWNELLTNSSQRAFIQENSASDGRYFSAKGMPTIVSKPEGGLIHTEEEWTSISSMENFAGCFHDFLME